MNMIETPDSNVLQGCMNIVDQLIQRASQTQRGFADIRKAAQEVVATHAPPDSLSIAAALFSTETHQARMLATFIFGEYAGTDESALHFLHMIVSRDPDWHVQEGLAKAFDRYCATVGYQQAVPVIELWLADEYPTVRRAVTEGLRVWTSRPYFCDQPLVAVRLLAQLRDDESEYVRTSVGNALRDISKHHPDLVTSVLKEWDCSDPRIAYIHKLVNRVTRKTQG
ncbi:MAG: DNA alkylation repair enzyme [Chloroflexi bacterium AL-W]|nr:DNA alkylation repair enzyme [Chloroflexi bacterium AL-N1]NOK66876.1 DNA alkylation repair enzyme [Chloroflexi bacterium AL-N10]NOK74832.1 DNA alkylation repair enzyme [Chloroflexi bacterium AL-N5]NOK81478.1 DNA alkylation repair enzyme [Chloroflexi bacterium AL-W]NOK88948.1 DNA alkylation repair enzyme [Chloroflexi bacterium AL-N15]